MSEERTPGSLESAISYELDELVTYSEGSVISRIILKNTAGNVTLFSFDDGQSLSEHTTPYEALVQVLDGEAELTIGGKPLVVGAGEIMIMPAGVPHAVFARSRFKMLLTMLKGK